MKNNDASVIIEPDDQLSFQNDEHIPLNIMSSTITTQLPNKPKLATLNQLIQSFQRNIISITIITLILISLSFITQIKHQTTTSESHTLIVNKTLNIHSLNKSAPKQYYEQNVISPFIENINFELRFDLPRQLSMKWTDQDNIDRFALPENSIFGVTKNNSKFRNDEQQFYAEIFDRQFQQFQPEENYYKKLQENLLLNNNNKPLELNQYDLKVKRKSTEESVFEVKRENLILSNHFLQFKSSIPTKYIYGLGERRPKFFKLRSGKYTIYTHDLFLTIDDGSSGGMQSYSHHPTYLMKEKSGLWHVVHFRSTNAIDVQLDLNDDDSNQQSQLTFTTIGGILDVKMFFGDHTPGSAIKLYHEYINGYALPPFFAFGFHQSKWGYDSSYELKVVAQKYREYDIPLDVLWSDLDYLLDRIPMAISPKYRKQELMEIQRDFQLKYIPIVQIHVTTGQKAFREARDNNILIMSGTTKEPLRGCAWSESVAFLDFNSPQTQNWWDQRLMQINYELAPIHGVWLDLNEPVSFFPGELRFGDECPPEMDSDTKVINHRGKDFNRSRTPEQREKSPSIHHSKELPYIPGALNLEEMSISIDGYHQPQGPFISQQQQLTEFDFHPINSLAQMATTYRSMQGALQTALPFVLSRSTMFGGQQFGAHWFGDNKSTLEYLQLSIRELLNMNIFGFTFSGADICGFNGNSDDQLCARWMQLGAFYPFTRSHNDYGSIRQEIYAFYERSLLKHKQNQSNGNDESLLETSTLLAGRSSLKLKYSLLKYYYMLFVRNQREYGPVIRAPFFEWPHVQDLLDIEEHADFYSNPREKVCMGCDLNFFIGKALLIVPATDIGYKLDVHAAIAKDEVFYRIFAGCNEVFDTFNQNNANSYTIFKTISFSNETAPVFLRAGHILQFQNTINVTNSDHLDNNFSLILAFKYNILEDKYNAKGTILGVSQLSEQKVVVAKCLEKNNLLTTLDTQRNCEIDITAVAVKTKKQSMEGEAANKFSIEIAFTQMNNMTFFDGHLCVDSLYIKGLVNNKTFRIHFKNTLEGIDKECKINLDYQYTFYFDDMQQEELEQLNMINQSEILNI